MNATRPVAAEIPLYAGTDLASIARLFADTTRATFCLALLDNRAWTPTELARHAGVALSTATEHLNALVAGGLLTEERQGRHRYVHLANPHIADLIETLAAAAPLHPSPAPRTLSADTRRRALAHARTCYDHLAGTLGVAITNAMTDHALIDWQQGLRLTPTGEKWLSDQGIKVAATGRRPALRPCLDWTERRPHLAGTIPAALCDHALAHGWIKRIGSTRAVIVTPAGRDVLGERLGLSAEILTPAAS
ncbi:putative transcriptional regulator, ArsR family [Catenulispora acidiphila DSM 44928]|uniref:Putative transcriptional regulator, ArsR family n=1 Tax=Catenulispora acidiphila (strain DSM 44928 / JCM 14897 / NBRC 102108 / NRRL B-24433 / ID139908) TaxID=479433 RepID=C7PY02_CATAD|nr:helix-turn-helix domain-containing protein [Catenulispora acidiphila]ACU73462.1 putative transcriptional regulator, ArsR family [Catenulispora acidiphila DSM 44928]